MGALRWYQRDPRAALAGMMELTLEERGAYNTILDLLYIHDGQIEDDDRLIAAWLKVDIRVWRRIRTTLIDRSKLYCARNSQGNFLRNERADQEVLRGLGRVASAAEAGIASAISRGHTPKKRNNLAPTTVERPFELSTSRKKESLPSLLDAPRENANGHSQSFELPPETHGPRRTQIASPILADLLKTKGWTP